MYGEDVHEINATVAPPVQVKRPEANKQTLKSFCDTPPLWDPYEAVTCKKVVGRVYILV